MRSAAQDNANGRQSTDAGVLDRRQNRVEYLDANGQSTYDRTGKATGFRQFGDGYVHTFATTYEGWESYQEKRVTGSSSNNNYKATTNTLEYDPYGRLKWQVENTPLKNGSIDDRMRYYAYNGDGQVQTRREGTIQNGQFTQTDAVKPNYLYVYAGGQQMAQLREGPKGIQSLSGMGTYEAGGARVTAMPGESLRQLAQRVYGSDQLWYVLAQANGLGDPDQEIGGGLQLDAPKVDVSRNDATTFKPYNPAEAMGPTTPSLPYVPPPPSGQCNPVVMMIMIVIAVVVTVYTAGAAAGAFGLSGGATASTAAVGSAALAGGATATTTLAATGGLAAATSVGVASAASAAVGGFFGAAASQVVGKTFGEVDSFSLRNAVAGGLTAGITAGVGSQFGSMGQLVDKGRWGSVAASGALSSAGAYVAGRAAGLDTSFSWRSISASAVTAMVGGKLNKELGTVLEGPGLSNGMLNDTIGGIVNSVVSLHTRRAFGFDDRVDYGNIAIDAFGNALGNAAIGKINDREGRRRIGPVTKQMIDRPNAEIVVGGIPGEITRPSLQLNLDSSTTPLRGAMRASTRLAPPSAAEVDAATQLQYIARMNDHLRRLGMPPLPDGTTYEGAKIRYDELNGGPPVYTLEDRVTVVAEGAYDPALDASWRSLYRTMQAGHGAGVLQLQLQNAYAQRTGHMPVYRPPQSQAWMGTGSRAAWHAEMARQTDENLGIVAAPIGLVGGAAKSVYDLAEFAVNTGRTVLGTSAYVFTLGAVGGDEFATASSLAKGVTNFAWNSAGNYVYTLSGSQLAQQEHAAYMRYVDATAGAALKLWDGTYGAWNRGDYLSSGETVGTIVGIPLPLAKAGHLGKLRVIDDVIVANSELTIAANAATGNPGAISRGLGTLNSRQAAVLEQLPEFGSSTIAHKAFGQRDLAALTAATGDEFAMFSTGGRRLIFRGDVGSVPINPDMASQLSGQGWRWSSHTHPGFEVGVLRSSPGDQAVLRAMGGNQSAIFNSMGQRGMFTPNGDSLNGWKPWW